MRSLRWPTKNKYGYFLRALRSGTAGEKRIRTSKSIWVVPTFPELHCPIAT